MGDVLAFSVFNEVAALLVLATVLGIASLVLRQPAIVAFIFVGIFSGPAVLSVARSTEHIELLADLGVALLLFLVGLKLDLHLIRSLGKVALATGLGQVAFTSTFGLAICLALGLDLTAALYVAVALTFSSTIIIVKLLTDKREVDSLHGRIALGFLIVQDLVVVVALASLSTLGISGVESAYPDFFMANRIVAGAVFIALAVGVWLIAEKLVVRLARAPELLITFTIGWAVAMAALGDIIGFGKEMGGLVAGVALSGSSLRDALSGRLTSLREFLLLFFFIALGSRIEFGMISGTLGQAAVLSLFVLIGNPLIVMAIMGVMGYRKRTGFLAGLTVAQISEFSLVFMAMGLSLGHVTPEHVGLVTMVGIVTITASTYMIYYSHQLYARLERFLTAFERKVAWREATTGHHRNRASPDVIVFGLGRYGSALARRLKQRGMAVLGVDFDPQVVRQARTDGLRTIFADITDPDMTSLVPVSSAGWAVCTAPAAHRGLMIDDPRLVFLQSLRQAGFAGQAVVAASDAADMADMRAAGANLVLLPFEDAAAEAADRMVSPKASVASRGRESIPTPKEISP